MTRPVGKIFEEDFQKSIPQDYYWYRLRDCPAGWTKDAPEGQEPLRRFTPRNGYDLFMYAQGHLFTLELKTVKGARFPLSNMSDLQETELAKAHAHDGVRSGLVVNYRELERTYFLPITAIWQARIEGVKSINMDMAERLGIFIPSKKKISRYTYDVQEFVYQTQDLYGRIQNGNP
jgi:recombination protein U